jgi:hypothetical protein
MNQFVDDGALRIRPLAVLNDIENQRLENSKIEEVLSAVLRIKTGEQLPILEFILVIGY